jgi:hypothetical protein
MWFTSSFVSPTLVRRRVLAIARSSFDEPPSGNRVGMMGGSLAIVRPSVDFGSSAAEHGRRLMRGAEMKEEHTISSELDRFRSRERGGAGRTDVQKGIPLGQRVNKAGALCGPDLAGVDVDLSLWRERVVVGQLAQRVVRNDGHRLGGTHVSFGERDRGRCGRGRDGARKPAARRAYEGGRKRHGWRKEEGCWSSRGNQGSPANVNVDRLSCLFEQIADPREARRVAPQVLSSTLVDLPHHLNKTATRKTFHRLSANLDSASFMSPNDRLPFAHASPTAHPRPLYPFVPLPLDLLSLIRHQLSSQARRRLLLLPAFLFDSH